MSMNTVPERLAALRAAMQANGVDVYLNPEGRLGRRPVLRAGRKGVRRY